MKNELKVLAIVGSPGGKRSNTLEFANSFLDMVEEQGVTLRREFIVLSNVEVRPCKGCWSCTLEKPCPLRSDDLESIKEKMIDCDMLILGSPVYTNQVTAQMKAFFDRLFTWCHVFPLIGKYALSVVTTGNDGHEETGSFLEKMLGTYGASSFGTVAATGAYSSGFHPRKASELEKHQKLAKKVASTIAAGDMPKPSPWIKKMFKTMKKKLNGVQLVNYIANGPTDGIPDPSPVMVKMFSKVMAKRNVDPADVKKLSRYMKFELNWWVERDWLGARSFKELATRPVPAEFNARERLVG